MKYTIFNAQGQILAQSECSELEAESLSALALPGAFEAGIYYVDVATKTAVAMPTRPSEFHTFNYNTKQWVANPDQAWASIRVKRDQRLTACDWTQLPDVAASPAWLDYRQALRDITLQTDPWAIVWPITP